MLNIFKKYPENLCRFLERSVGVLPSGPLGHGVLAPTLCTEATREMRDSDVLCFPEGALSPQARGPSCAEYQLQGAATSRGPVRGQGAPALGFRLRNHTLAQLIMLTDFWLSAETTQKPVLSPRHQSTCTSPGGCVPRTRKVPSAGGRRWLPHPQCLTGSCGPLSVPGSASVLS